MSTSFTYNGFSYEYRSLCQLPGYANFIYIYIDNITSIYLDTWKKKIEGINAKNLFINVTHRVSFDREEIGHRVGDRWIGQEI